MGNSVENKDGTINPDEVIRNCELYVPLANALGHCCVEGRLSQAAAQRIVQLANAQLGHMGLGFVDGDRGPEINPVDGEAYETRKSLLVKAQTIVRDLYLAAERWSIDPSPLLAVLADLKEDEDFHGHSSMWGEDARQTVKLIQARATIEQARKAVVDDSRPQEIQRAFVVSDGITRQQVIEAAEQVVILVSELRTIHDALPEFARTSMTDAEKQRIQRAFDIWWKRNCEIGDEALYYCDVLVAYAGTGLGTGIREWIKRCDTPHGREHDPWDNDLLATVISEAEAIERLARNREIGGTSATPQEKAAAAPILADTQNGKAVEPGEPIILNTNEISVLKALNTTKQYMGLATIEAAAYVSRRTIPKLLHQLIELKLVARKGERGGWCITSKGISELESRSAR